MKYACKCLNIIIEGRGVSDRVDRSTLSQLSGLSRQIEDLELVKPKSISVRLGVLLGENDNDNWRDYHCRNCHLWMYCCAIDEIGPDPQIPPARIILKSSSLIKPDDLEEIKEHPNFSPTFEILIFNCFDSDLFAGSTVDENTPFYPKANAWLSEQSKLVAKRIGDFSNKLLEELNKKERKVIAEQHALERAIAADSRPNLPGIDERAPSTAGSDVSTDARVTLKNRLMEFLEADFELDESLLFESKTSLPLAQSEDSDEEPTEIEPQPSTSGIAFRESSSFEDEPGSRRMSLSSMARSLPIDVPKFMGGRHDDRREKTPPLDPTDIAANIKALARSVHGNPIFGDLPPPRFTKD